MVIVFCIDGEEDWRAEADLTIAILRKVFETDWDFSLATRR